MRIERLDLVEAGEDELAELVRRKQPEVIYHLAAQSNPQQSVADPRGTWALNLGGTLNLLEAVKASGMKPRVILVSSGTCYGDPAPEFIPVREDCPLRPNNPYAASKAAADLLGIQHRLAHGTDVVIVRPFNHAGPRQSPRYVLAALAAQVAEVEAGHKQSRRGRQPRRRPRLHRRPRRRPRLSPARRARHGRRDLQPRLRPGDALADALEHAHGAGADPDRRLVDPARVRPVDQPLLVADPAKLRAATGWEPRFPIEQTLADMLQYWRDAVACGV